jgi:hypothetical protein
VIVKMAGVSEQTRVAGRQNVRKCRSRNARALVPNPDRATLLAVRRNSQTESSRDERARKGKTHKQRR